MATPGERMRLQMLAAGFDISKPPAPAESEDDESEEEDYSEESYEEQPALQPVQNTSSAALSQIRQAMMDRGNIPPKELAVQQIEVSDTDDDEPKMDTTVMTAATVSTTQSTYVPPDPPLFRSASEQASLQSASTAFPSNCGVEPPMFISASEYRARNPTKPSVLFEKYVKFIDSPLNQDKTMKLLQYLLWFLSRYYVFPSGREGLRKLSGDIGFARMALRLLGTPTALHAYQTGSWSLDSNKPIHKLLGKILAGSMVGYYPAEALAYTHWMVPKWLARGRSAEIFSAWSCRCWLAYIAAESVQCLLQWKDSDDKDEQRDAQLKLVRNALWTLPALHWSLPNWDRKPWLSDGVVNGLMLAEAVVSMYQGIVNMAQ